MEQATASVEINRAVVTSTGVAPVVLLVVSSIQNKHDRNLDGENLLPVTTISDTHEGGIIVG